MADAPNTSGMLYVQKIAELEELNKSLGRDLELLRETEQCLLQDSREKDDLTAFLMRKVKLAELEEGASRRRENAKPRTGNTALSMIGRMFPQQARRDAPIADVDELEHEAAEALRDNVRLRNDLRVLGEEYKKLVIARATESEHQNTQTATAGEPAQCSEAPRIADPAEEEDEEF